MTTTIIGGEKALERPASASRESPRGRGSHLRHDGAPRVSDRGALHQAARRRRRRVPADRRDRRDPARPHALAGRAPAPGGVVLPDPDAPRPQHADLLDPELRDRDPVLRSDAAPEQPALLLEDRVGRLRLDARRRDRHGLRDPVRHERRPDDVLRAAPGALVVLSRPDRPRGGGAARRRELLRHALHRQARPHLRRIGAARRLRRHGRGDHRRRHDPARRRRDRRGVPLGDRPDPAARRLVVPHDVVGPRPHVAADQRVRHGVGVVPARNPHDRSEAPQPGRLPRRVRALHPVHQRRVRPPHPRRPRRRRGLEDLEHVVRDVPRGAGVDDPRLHRSGVRRGRDAAQGLRQGTLRLALRRPVVEPGVLGLLPLARDLRLRRRHHRRRARDAADQHHGPQHASDSGPLPRDGRGRHHARVHGGHVLRRPADLPPRVLRQGALPHPAVALRRRDHADGHRDVVRRLVRGSAAPLGHRVHGLAVRGGLRLGRARHAGPDGRGRGDRLHRAAAVDPAGGRDGLLRTLERRPCDGGLAHREAGGGRVPRGVGRWTRGGRACPDPWCSRGSSSRASRCTTSRTGSGCPTPGTFGSRESA